MSGAKTRAQKVSFEARVGFASSGEWTRNVRRRKLARCGKAKQLNCNPLHIGVECGKTEGEKKRLDKNWHTVENLTRAPVPAFPSKSSSSPFASPE